MIFSTDGTQTFRRLSFEEADQEEREMYRAMTPQQRLDLQAQLIMMHYGPNPPRLERVLGIIQTPKDRATPQTQSDTRTKLAQFSGAALTHK